MHVFVHMCVVCMHMETRAWHLRLPQLFFHRVFCRQGLSLVPELVTLATLLGQRAPGPLSSHPSAAALALDKHCAL